MLNSYYTSMCFLVKELFFGIILNNYGKLKKNSKCLKNRILFSCEHRLLPPRSRQVTDRYEPVDNREQRITNITIPIFPVSCGVVEICRKFDNGFRYTARVATEENGRLDSRILIIKYRVYYYMNSDFDNLSLTQLAKWKFD